MLRPLSLTVSQTSRTIVSQQASVSLKTLLFKRSLTTTSRMSSSQKEWLVQIPDKPNALQKRLAARSDHLKNVTPKVDAGQVSFGGATLSKHPAEGETPDMTGSVMLVKAETKEEVIELLKSDVYTKQGAWDVDNATITAFRTAIRTAL